MNRKDKINILKSIFIGREISMEPNGNRPCLLPEGENIDMFIVSKLQNAKILLQYVVEDQVIVSDLQEDIDNGTLNTDDINRADETWIFFMNEYHLEEKVESLDWIFLEVDWIYLLKLSRKLSLNIILNDI